MSAVSKGYAKKKVEENEYSEGELKAYVLDFVDTLSPSDLAQAIREKVVTIEEVKAELEWRML